jgi:hypothetical protein
MRLVMLIISLVFCLITAAHIPIQWYLIKTRKYMGQTARILDISMTISVVIAAITAFSMHFIK